MICLVPTRFAAHSTQYLDQPRNHDLYYHVFIVSTPGGGDLNNNRKLSFKTFFYIKLYSQNAPVVLLLIHLVSYI